jgi:hypothetical protein
MVINRLPRLGLSSFHLRREQRGAPLVRQSSPNQGPLAQPLSEVCGICGQTIAEGEATVTVRHGPTTLDPIPPLLPAHSSCFRRELLPKW